MKQFLPRDCISARHWSGIQQGAAGQNRLSWFQTAGSRIGPAALTAIRTPAAGSWNVKGYNLENYGALPDVAVDNPGGFLAGRDAQLEKAVEVLK